MKISFSIVSFLAVLALSLSISVTAPGAAAEQGPSQSQLPRGVIVMWSGSVEEIPEGWSLCDGTNGTPDLRDRFVVGAGETRQIGVKGGSYSHNHQEQSHSHRITLPRSRVNAVRVPYGFRSNYGSLSYKTYRQRDYGSSQTFNSSAATVKIQAARHLPPYFKIAFIMKN